MPKTYRMLKNSKISDVKKGDVVYQFIKYDYGLAGDDTRLTGIQHISVTLNNHNDYPFFTVPLYDLEEIK